MSCLVPISLTCFSKRDRKSFFEPTIAGAASAVTYTSFFKSSCIFGVHSRKPSKKYFPVVLPLSTTNSTSSSVIVNSGLIPWKDLANCTVSFLFQCFAFSKKKLLSIKISFLLFQFFFSFAGFIFVVSLVFCFVVRF